MENSKNNKVAREYSLYDIFKEGFEIEIPIIQRDYAQGRDSAKDIRESFLSEIKRCLEERKKLKLDFAYGSTIEDGQGKKFIPLDGQQRLTTLYLLYWYFAVKEGKLERFREIFAKRKENNHYESKFRYKTRVSSQEFLNFLVSEDLDINNLIDDKISETIKDRNWFYLVWKNDPTIVGMLNMLDDIHNTFKDFSSEIFENLLLKESEENPITFYFLELENFGLTDDLYIKMNSRGKLLTPFENFKAKLEKLIESKKEKSEFLEIAKKFDVDYTDIFWQIAKEKNKEENLAELTDKYLYRFFYNLTLNLCALDNKDDLKNYNSLDEFIKDNPLLSFYEKVFSKEENLNDLLNFLDKLKNINSKFFEDILKENPSLWDRVRFFAFYKWVLNHENDKHWYRVLKNLINNTRIESLEEYIRAIESIDNLSSELKNQSKNILDYIKDKEKFLDFFSESQQREESLKAQLILKNNGWEEQIKKAEENWYLDGKIGFLIDFSERNLDKFIQYRERFEKLWGFAKEKKENQILIYQALLTKGDYLPEIGRNKTFCSFETSLRSKVDNWYKVFENESKREHLKNLLDYIDYIDITNDNIKEQLEGLINGYAFDINDWRSLFVKNKKLIEYCEKLQLRFKEDGKIYLLVKTKIYGRHAELHSFYLFNEILSSNDTSDGELKYALKTSKKFQCVEYVESYSENEEPYILLSDWNYKEGYSFQLKILYDGNNQFKVIFSEKDKKDIPEEIKEILEKKGFKKGSDEKECEKYISKEAFDKILALIKEFVKN